MERMERLRECLDSWDNLHPNLKELTWELYIDLRKRLEEYDAERTARKYG